MHGIKGKLTELSTIMYACISFFTSIGFMASILLIPNCSAFPISHVYEAYVNNHVGRITLFVTFGFELFLMSIFVWKMCWISPYIQIYTLVAPTWMIILRLVV